MDMKARVRPREHAGRLLPVEELQPHEQPKGRAAKRLGQARGVVRGPRHKRPIGPEPAVRDEQMQVRMPIGVRAVRLETGHDPHREVTLTGQRADRGGDRAGGDTGDLAEQASPIQAIRAKPCSRMPQARNLSVTSPTTGRHGPYSNLY
jgi:hypothetical protein